jgi:hypothetical protein
MEAGWNESRKAVITSFEFYDSNGIGMHVETSDDEYRELISNSREKL